MIDAKLYMKALIEQLRERFGERLCYVGLQGSYLRGEATEKSDIDPMVVIDGLSVQDLAVYRNVIQGLDHYERSCGFICGREELRCWNPLEICHLIHSTEDYYGQLSALVPACTQADMRNFIKLSLNNLYHEICHRYLHAAPEKNAAKIAGSYKGTFFILQNIYYLQTGIFAATKRELLPLLTGKHRQILQTAMDMNDGKTYTFEDAFSQLYSWCRETMICI